MVPKKKFVLKKLSRILGPEKKCGPKKVFDPENKVGPKIFWSQNKVGADKFFVYAKKFGPQNIFCVIKKIWCQQENFVPIFLDPQENFGPKFFLIKHLLTNTFLK